MVDASWRNRAVCTTVDPELFFPTTGRSPDAAKQVCASCPVRPECLDAALWYGDTFGVWGATTRHERQQMPKPAITSQTQAREQTVATVLKLRDQGLLNSRIAEQLGVNERTVYRILRRAADVADTAMPDRDVS